MNEILPLKFTLDFFDFRLLRIFFHKSTIFIVKTNFNLDICFCCV